MWTNRANLVTIGLKLKGNIYMTTKKPLAILIDGNSFIHRSFHALPAFTNKYNHPTGAISGTLNMINSILNRYAPDKLIVCFDAKGKTFRHDIFPEYKGTRPPSDPDLSVQFEPLKKIVKAWGLPMLCIEGVEADDTMGTVANAAVDLGYDVVISTSDKDMRQVVSVDIKILDTKDTDSNEPYGIDGVIKRMGVPPSQVKDLLALMGDKTDNIPGVNKVGQDTASKWLAQYGSLENIMANANDFKGKRGEYLRDALDVLPLSYRLVTIDTKVHLPCSFDQLTGHRDEKALFELSTTYELNQFKKALDIRNPDAVSLENEIVHCETDAAINILNNKLSKPATQTLYIDASNSNDNHVCLGINNIDKIYCVEIDKVSSVLRERYEMNNFPLLIGNGIKDVIVRLIGSGGLPIYPKVKLKDTRLYYYSQFGGKSNLPSIMDLNNTYAQFSLSPLRKEFKLDDKAAKWNKLDATQWAIVKAEELMLAHKIAMIFSGDNNSILSVEEKYSLNEEAKLLPLLATMQSHGLLIDKPYLAELDESLERSVSDLEREIKDNVGVEDINLSSPKQVGNLLYNIMGIPTKNPTTKESAMLKLVDKYPVVKDILKYRSLSKIRSTYVVGLMNRMDSDNFIHPKFNQGLTSTGRLSAEDPNVQSIPLHGQEAKKVRRAFVAIYGYKVVALDYSQIELRVLAHMSQDTYLIEAFNSGKDIHKVTASEVLGIPYDDVTDDHRRLAKAINFGLIYGKGAKALSEETGFLLAEAKEFIESYFTRYSRVKEYMAEQLIFAKENGYVLTDTGRKIFTPNVNASAPIIRVHAELSAKNGGIQGTAADIVRDAMNKATYRDEGALLSDNVLMLMQVHDELVFYIKDNAVDTYLPLIKDIMENSYSMTVPLVVEVKCADNWKDAH
jgi:DNA polymerase-1